MGRGNEERPLWGVSKKLNADFPHETIPTHTDGFCEAVLWQRGGHIGANATEHSATVAAVMPPTERRKS